VVSRAVFLNGPGGTNALTAHTSNLHSLFYMDTGSDGKLASIFVDSNYNLTISASDYCGQGTSNQTHYAIAALTPTTAIAAFQGTGSDGFAGTLTLTPTPVISGQLLGIAETSATNGATASVAIGPIVEGTYTSGADYYVSGSGGIGETASPVRVGKAKSTTELVLDLDGNPSAGKVLSGEITVPGAFTWVAPFDGEYVLTFCAGGGSGGQASSITKPAGNGGNTVVISRTIAAGTSISGTIGAGGDGQASTNTAGNTGGDSTLSVNGVTFIAKGGKGGIANGSVDCHVNNDNESYAFNLLGTTGKYAPFGASVGQSGGVPQLLGANPKVAAGAATRGGGSWGSNNSGTTGKGGDGVFRWELVIGS
jgi:hypothetical protein